MKIYPLSEDETTQLLVLLRKIWKEERGEQDIKSIAKSLFSLITRKLYEIADVPCQQCGGKRDVEALFVRYSNSWKLATVAKHRQNPR